MINLLSVRPRRVPFLVFALVTVMSLSSAADTRAAYDPVGSGSTTLVLAKPFQALLARHGVRVEARGGAIRRGLRITLPATGGEVDPTIGNGTVESEGSIVFVAGRRTLPFRRVQFKAKRSPLYAKVGGGQLKLATAEALRATRKGFGASFNATGLRLTAKAASRLGKKLRLGKELQAGQLLGSVQATANPSTVHLMEENRLHLALDPGFVEKLNSLFVSLNPVAPAELSAGPALSFPVGLESTLAPDASAGTVKLGGAVELLQLGSAQVFWREIWLEAGAAVIRAETEALPSPPHPGKQPQSDLLSVTAGGIVKSNAASRTIEISGRPLVLQTATAQALNNAFAAGSQVFSAGELVGSFSLTGKGQ